LEPDRRIAFTWNPGGGQPDTSSLVTVEFLDCVDGVEVCVTHRELTTGQATDMDIGWNSTLDSLEEYVSEKVRTIPVCPQRRTTDEFRLYWRMQLRRDSL
jgi:hypothetical protein